MKRPSGTRVVILGLMAAMLLTFLAGTATVSRATSGAQALTPVQWAALQASNALLLEQGPVSVYLPVVQRQH